MRHPVVITGLICIVCIAACAALLGFPSRSTGVSIQADSEVSETGKGSVKADILNSEGVDIYVDGQPYTGSGSGNVIISDNFDIMIPSADLNDLFNCDVAPNEDGTVSISSTQSVTDEDKSVSGEIEKDRTGCVDARKAAVLLGYSIELNENQGIVYINSPESKATELPESFDLRDEGKISSIRDQGNQGNCWAFAAVSALESTLLPDQVWDFSEDNMVNKSGFSTGSSGGDYNMALAYLLSWRGPVTEEEDPYGDGYSPDGLSAAVHVQDAVILNDRDYDQIKSLIYHNGAVQSAMYCPSDAAELAVYYSADNASYYYPESHDCSHDMDIIGWDDNYPKENFNIQPSADGAFICRNSWGENFGEDGYFYISYEDPNIGIYGAAYTGIEASDNYDNIYQSDLLGWTGSIGYNGPEAMFASVYTAGSNEKLRAAGFYSTDAGTWYDIYLVHNVSSSADFADREYIKSGYFADKGFFTVDLGSGLDLNNGERFAVIIDIYTKGSVHPVAMEYARNSMSSGADISDGETYMSSDGKLWTDLEDTQECNACLKIYTDSE